MHMHLTHGMAWDAGLTGADLEDKGGRSGGARGLPILGAFLDSRHVRTQPQVSAKTLSGIVIGFRLTRSKQSPSNPDVPDTDASDIDVERLVVEEMRHIIIESSTKSFLSIKATFGNVYVLYVPRTRKRKLCL